MQQTLSYLKSIGKTEYLLRVLSDNEVYAIFFGLLVRNSELNLRKLIGKSVYILFGLLFDSSQISWFCILDGMMPMFSTQFYIRKLINMCMCLHLKY